MMTTLNGSTAQGPRKPDPAVQRAATLGDAAQAADAMTEQSDDELGEQLAEAAEKAAEQIAKDGKLNEASAHAALAVMAQVLDRMQTDGQWKDTWIHELIFMHGQLLQLVEKLQHAVMSQGGTNFQGLLELSMGIMSQCANIFANGMMPQYRGRGGGAEAGPKPRPVCTLCDDKGMPDVGDDGKTIIKACPECGATGAPEGENKPTLAVNAYDHELDDDDDVVSPTAEDCKAVADDMAVEAEPDAMSKAEHDQLAEREGDEQEADFQRRVNDPDCRSDAGIVTP